MTPEEIAVEISKKNRDMLCTWSGAQRMTQDEILALMDEAAMRGFRFGSDVALSMVQASLLLRLARAIDAKEMEAGVKNKPG
jgi:hypothetical protein